MASTPSRMFGDWVQILFLQCTNLRMEFVHNVNSMKAERHFSSQILEIFAIRKNNLNNRNVYVTDLLSMLFSWPGGLKTLNFFKSDTIVAAYFAGTFETHFEFVSKTKTNWFCCYAMDEQERRMLRASFSINSVTIRRVFKIVIILILGELRIASGTDLCPKEYRVCSNWDCPRLSPNCPGGRGGSDPCDCCTVCLRQVGDRCSVPKQPCDAQFGLYCKHGRCRGR